MHRKSSGHPFHPPQGRFFLSLLAMALLVGACGNDEGGGGNAPPPSDTAPPTVVSVLPADGATAGTDDPLVIVFSESMDPATLVLGGLLAADDDGGVWSATGGNSDDTLTVSPAPFWPAGAGKTLTVDGDDLAGNPLASLSLSFHLLQVVYVSVDDAAATDGGTGSRAAPFMTIAAAVGYADSQFPEALLRVAAGGYDVDFQGSGDHLVLVEGISLFGGYAPDWSGRDPETFVSAITDLSATGGGGFASPNRAVQAGAGITAATVLDGFSVTGGSGDFNAAIFVMGGGAPTIENNTINGGGGGSSYGISNDNSAPTIQHNILQGGTGSDLSAAIHNNASAPTIRFNTIDGGSGDDSRGVSNSTSDPVIANNTIQGGSGAVISFGIYNESVPAPTIRNNAVHGGTGGDTIGIFNFSAAPAIQNNTINGGDGGLSAGIYTSFSGFPAVDNNIVFTSAGTTRYCMVEEDAASGAASLHNNNLFDCPTALYRHNGTTDVTDIADVNGFADIMAGGNVSTNPQFEDQAGGDWHLTASSPAGVTAGGLNGVDEGWGFTDDRDGVARPVSGNPWAMGAYEP